MKKFSIKIQAALIAVFSSISIGNTALAYSEDLSLTDGNVRFSTNTFLEGKIIRIYASATNNSGMDLLGTVRFYNNGSQIGGDQAISIFSHKTDDVFIDWKPPYGTQKITVKIFPWNKENDDPSNNQIERTIYVEQDTDYDGAPNTSDSDDDNDGIPDDKDAFPLNKNEWADTDGDGTGDNTDTDDDNDGVPDSKDGMPLDPNETIDTDGDGIGDNTDTDDDNDGLLDTEEINIKTNPLLADTDGDGTSDENDPFPLNDNEWMDTDSDGIGNNKDTDDDNDGLLDKDDKFPLNISPVLQIESSSLKTASLNEEKIFDASDSYDKDGEIINYTWTIDDNIVKEGPAITHIFDQKGNHSVKLTIRDNSGESQTKNFQISVMNIKFYGQILSLLGVFIIGAILSYKYLRTKKK